MYPHERSLAIRLAAEPFVLLGVNSDQDRVMLRKVIEKEGITWRSWWDGGSTDGPIANKWQISSWPTIYVLDAKGVIRHIDASGANVNFEAIENIVDSLLEELIAKSGS